MLLLIIAHRTFAKQIDFDCVATKTTPIQQESGMKLLYVFLSLALFSPTIALTQSSTDNATTQKLVNELKKLTDQAERDRSGSYHLIDQLRDLTARYDQPWDRRVLFDDFRDGDFLHNPVWHNNSDDFWVTRSIGLRTELNSQAVQPQTQHDTSPEAAIIGMILGTNRQHNQVQQTAPRHVRADLSTAISISNAFSMTMNISAMGRGNQSGSFEFGPYQGQNMESGYRLMYQAGTRPALKLLRYRHNTSAVIDIYDAGNLLEDGNMHKLNWQRSIDGLMTVSLDGRRLIQVRDRSYRDPFNGLVMTNRGGDYGIRSVSVFSSGR